MAPVGMKMTKARHMSTPCAMVIWFTFFKYGIKEGGSAASSLAEEPPEPEAPPDFWALATATVNWSASFISQPERKAYRAQ